MHVTAGYAKISFYLALSLLIHAVLLLPWVGPLKQALPLDNSPESFSVQLEKEKRPLQNTTTSAAVQTTRKKQQSPDTHVTSSQPSSKFSIPMAEIHAQIRTRLAEYFVYPRLAQRRGQEGKVILAFQLLHTGEIHNVRVQRSSGYALLDDAAMHSLTRINRMESLIPSLNGHDIEVELPVTYRLQQG